MILLNILFLFIQSDTNKVDVIFVGGLEKVISYKEQVRSLKSGFGNNCNVLQFRHKSSTNKIVEAIVKNPNVPVILFSAGCNKAIELIVLPCVNKKLIFLVEPYSPNQRLSEALVINKFPARNVFVGPTPARGSRLIGNGTPMYSKSHLDALRIAATLIKTKNK